MFFFFFFNEKSRSWFDFFLNSTKVKHKLHGGSTLRIKNKTSAEKRAVWRLASCKLQVATLKKKKRRIYIYKYNYNK